MPALSPQEVHAANIRRAIEAGEESDHDFSIWSEDDQSSTDGERDLRFLANGESEEESDDDRFSDEPPAKRHFPWPGNLSDYDSDDDDDDVEDEDNEGPAGGRYSSDDEPAGSSADSADDGDDEGSDGP